MAVDTEKVTAIEDVVSKTIESLTDYQKALIYAQLNRQGMTLDRAAAMLRKGPE